MTDYRVTVKVRNNRLLAAAEAKGCMNGRELARAAEVPYEFVNSLINMVVSPLDRNGDIKPGTYALMVFLGKSLDDLFTELQVETLQRNTTETIMGEDRLLRLTGDPYSFAPTSTLMLDRDPTELAQESQIKEEIKRVLNGLTSYEEEIIRLRFGIDRNDGEPMTLAEVGEMVGLTDGRIQQIEQKVLRKLRHPSRSERVRQLIDIEGEVE